MLSAKAIRELRSSLEMTQEEFGKEIGVNRVTVARWETGERSPSPDFEGPLYELRHKDGWPTGEFFDDALSELKKWCGSAALRRLREKHKASKRALLRVAETFIEATGTHPERYLDISAYGDRSTDLLEAAFRRGLIVDENLRGHVEEHLRRRYRPQALYK